VNKTKDYGQEKVLVVPLEKLSLWEGLRPASQDMLETFRQNSSFVLRNKAEGNPQLKQIIPYCVLCNIDSNGIKRLFHAKRKSGADRELKSKWTIGIGGHINPKDDREIYRECFKENISLIGLAAENNFDTIVINCVKRELDEEVVINWNDVAQIRYHSLLFTSTDSVSKDHLAIVLLIELKTTNIKIREEELADGCFFSEEEFMIYTDYVDWLHWLHTPEGMEMERNCKGIISACAVEFMTGPIKNN